MSARMTGADSRGPRQLAGVRFPGSPLVTMCESGEESWTPGAWVLVDGPNGVRAGRVVVVPGQWRGAPGIASGRVLRSLSLEELVTLSPAGNAARPTETGPDIGSTGPVHPSRHAHQEISRLSLGGEDERLRRLKHGLPRLGQRIAMDDGHGIVVAVDTVRRLVTCAIEGEAAEIIVPADDVVPATFGN